MVSVRTAIALEYHFLRDASGLKYAQKHHHYAFWSRYLDVFDEVVVFGRARVTAQVPSGWSVVEGPRVSFVEVPDYVGPAAFTRIFMAARQAARLAVSK